MRSIPVNKVNEFEKEFLDAMERKHKSTLDALKAGQFTDEITKTLEDCAKDLLAKYK